MSSMHAVFPTQSSNIAPGFQAKMEEQATENPELVRLRSKHELWKVYAPEWELYLAAYEGGPDFANGKNVFKHVRENQEDYSDRVNRLHYINHCDQLVDFFTNFVY